MQILKYLSLWSFTVCLTPTVFASVQFQEPNSKLSLNLSAITQDASTDLQIAMAIPTSYGWGGIGIGSQMAGALMFILLPDSTNGSTISVRSASGNDMPTQLTGINFEMLGGSTQGGLMQAQGICKGCTSWPGGSFSTADTSQPFIWAVRQGTDGVDGSGAGANIEQHSDYGAFGVDMTKALQTGTTSQASSYQLPNNDLVVTHAVILVGAFGIVMPLAVIALRIPRLGFKPHWMLQVLALAGVVLGVAIAIYMSAASTAFSHFNQFHQILGILIVPLVATQAGLGRLHHTNFKKLKRRSTVSYFHLWLGRSLIPTGMLNAVLGFLLAASTTKAIGAAVVAVLIYIGTFAFAWYHRRSEHPYQGLNRSTDWYPLTQNGSTSEWQGGSAANRAPTDARNEWQGASAASRAPHEWQEYATANYPSRP